MMTMTSGNKGCIGFIGFIALTTGIIVWTDRFPTPTVRYVQIGSAIVLLLSIACMFFPAPKNLAPDFLFQWARKRNRVVFEKDEFCFTFTVSDVDGILFVNALYQNQHDSRCTAQIVMHPAAAYLGAKDACLTFEIECEPGEFGIASIPVPTPREYQGQEWKFKVGVTVERPDGVGTCVRFESGSFVRANSNLRSGLGTALQVAGALGGMIVTGGYAELTFSVPEKLRDKLPANTVATVETLWKLGDSEEIKFAELMRQARANAGGTMSR